MWIGNPLIRYNFENERLNGNYRYSLVRIRDQAENIAFYRGEQNESRHLSLCFKDIIRNRWRITRQSVLLGGFNSLLTQGVQLLPLMLQAPRFFAGKITIGDMHQTVQAFNRLQKSLSFFRNFYEKFTIYRARLKRLADFMAGAEAGRYAQIPQYLPEETGSADVALNNVLLTGIDGQRKTELKPVSFRASAGDALLLQGPSGSGKTSLLRLLAGIWPFGYSGSFRLPLQKSIMFVPQRPYVPEGNIRDILCYPDIEATDQNIKEVLFDCRLSFLQDQLDCSDNWQQRLSPGEQQRIAFCRILLKKPGMVLLDEATSALDEPTEAHLYELLRVKLPQMIIISVGHRSSLQPFHNKVCNLS